MTIVVVLVLVGIGLPWLFQQRLASRQIVCERRLSQTAVAVHAHRQQQGHLPGYRVPLAHEGGPSMSWVVPVLPYLGRDDERRPTPAWVRPALEYLQREEGGPPRESPEAWAERLDVPLLVCPADALSAEGQGAGRLSWVVNTGMPDAGSSEKMPPDWPANGVFLDQLAPATAPVTLAWIEARDGAQNTLLLSENIDSGRWTDTEESLLGFVWVPGVESSPVELPQVLAINERRGEGDGTLRFARPSSFHQNGVNVVFCNGRTQLLNAEIDPVTLIYLMTPDSSEIRYPGTDELIPPPYRIE